MNVKIIASRNLVVEGEEMENFTIQSSPLKTTINLYKVEEKPCSHSMFD